MLKALLKKQLLEINSFYFQNKKKGEARSKNSTILIISLFILMYISMLGAFYGMSSLFAASFVSVGLDWLYFAMMGLIALFCGTFGSVFTAYTSLYKAKDNELLLSMPVTPSAILFIRMLGVYVMGVIYTSCVWLPAIVCYSTYTDNTISGLIFCIFSVILLPLLVTVLACFMGWVVGLFSGRSNNKVLVAVVSSLAIFLVYYFIYFRMNDFLNSVAENGEEIGEKMRSFAYPVYIFGLASTGEIIPILIITVAILILFAILYYILSKTIFSILTKNRGTKYGRVKASDTRIMSQDAALIKKELGKFTTSPAYMMNMGLGLILLPIAAVLSVFKGDFLIEKLTEMAEGLPDPQLAFNALPALITAACCLVVSMNAIAACSISLEGVVFPLLKSLPIDVYTILKAKMKTAIMLNSVPAAIFTLVAGTGLTGNFLYAVLMTICTLSYVCFAAAFGLYLNLRHCNLEWTNETVPIKQGFATTVALFSGWGMGVVIAALGIGASLIFNSAYIMLLPAAVFIILFFKLNNTLKTKGETYWNEIA